MLSQGYCASCYAFAAAAAIESAVAIAKKATVSVVSPQPWVDCFWDFYGCGEGLLRSPRVPLLLPLLLLPLRVASSWLQAIDSSILPSLNGLQSLCAARLQMAVTARCTPCSGLQARVWCP